MHNQKQLRTLTKKPANLSSSIQRKRRWSSVAMSAVAIVVLAIFGAGLCVAQTASTGALSGTITDPSGAVVAGVQIKLTNETTGETRNVTSRSDGSFLIPLLAPGSYRLETIMTGFKPTVRSGIRVNVTETATLNIQLEVGSATEHITVSATPSLHKAVR